MSRAARSEERQESDLPEFLERGRFRHLGTHAPSLHREREDPMESREGRIPKSSVALRLLLNLQDDRVILPSRSYLARATG